MVPVCSVQGQLDAARLTLSDGELARVLKKMRAVGARIDLLERFD
ncbi:hypothetical protein [Burkholderia pseudomallei]|nr:hypothetical protein [Burkholderia pseudomallei]